MLRVERGSYRSGSLQFLKPVASGLAPISHLCLDYRLASVACRENERRKLLAIVELRAFGTVDVSR